MDEEFQVVSVTKQSTATPKQPPEKRHKISSDTDDLPSPIDSPMKPLLNTPQQKYAFDDEHLTQQIQLWKEGQPTYNDVHSTLMNYFNPKQVEDIMQYLLGM